MGLVAVLGDTHGNKEAWDAVNRSIAKKVEGGAVIDYFVCTGDIVGYGPDPRAVLKSVYEAQAAGNWLVVKGNHDGAAASKLVHPEAVIAENIGIKGLGGYEGIHLAVRQLCGDSAPIPPKPAELAGLEHGSDQYKAVLHEWRKTQVEPHTQEVIRRASGYSQQQVAALKQLCAGAGNGMPLRQRFARSHDLKGYCIEDTLTHLNLQEQRAGVHYWEQYIQGRENDELRRYIAGLQHSVQAEIKSGSASVPILLVHDNPFEPGNTKYVVERSGRERLRLSSPVHRIDEIFGAWGGKWPDVKVIFFGHSHIHGVYADNGRLIINPGSVGIPRSDELEATYALWDPEVEGKNSVEIVRIKRAGWRMTREKMKQYGLPDKFAHVHSEVA